MFHSHPLESSDNYEDNLLIDPPKSGSQVTYEELRKKNREEFEKRNQSPFNRPISRELPPISREPEPREEVQPRNKYGDVWMK